MAVTLFKITGILYLSILCSASAPSLLYGQSQAKSSQSLFQNDGSNKYKFPQSTEKTLQKKDTAQVAPIQYAPLYSPEFRTNNEMDLFAITKDVKEHAEVRKKHLEPKIPSSEAKNLASYPHSSLPCVPGHNIEILQSVNRSPGLPLEYRSISETTDASLSKNGKENYHRAFSVFRKPENIINIGNQVHVPSDISVASTNEPLDEYTRVFKLITSENHDKNYKPDLINPVLHQQLLKNHETLQDIHELTKQIEAQRVVGYPKMNTLLLNLARVYSPRGPTINLVNYLDPVNENVISKNVISNNVKSNSQSIRSPANKYTSDTKRSRILPVLLTNPHLSMRTQK